MSLLGPLFPLCGNKGPMRGLLSALLALWLLALAPPALAATPQTSISDVEDEVMCPICGTLLELAESPQAERERVFVKRLIAEGRTKGEIKDALVAQYGREVLALPSGAGFDLTAYLAPAIAFVLAAGGLAFGVRRWRQDGKASSGSPQGEAAERPRAEDAERLDADLARYDL
jgi:cytochrome c-type biogenesis protein CcmH